MTIPEKKAYKLYLDEENVEFLRNYLRNRRDQKGLSGLVDKYLARCVWMIKNNQDIFDKIDPGKLTFSKFWQLLKLQVRLSDEEDNCDTEKDIVEKGWGLIMENFEDAIDLEKLAIKIAELTAAKVSEKMATPRWLKLKDAMYYSSCSRSQLLKLAKEDLIAGRQDPTSKRGDWKFDKKSIDEYMISQIVGERHKALSIIESLAKP